MNHNSKPYKKRFTFKSKKLGRVIGKYERCTIRSKHGAFMFQISMEDRREAWLNDRKKFYSNISLRDFNLGMIKRGLPTTSIQEHRKRFDNVVYWGEDR